MAGFIVALAFLVVSGFLIYEGHDVAGTTLGTIDIVSLVSTFLYATHSRRAERSERARLMTGR